MPTFGTGKITQFESFISTIQPGIESIVKHEFEEKKSIFESRFI